MEDFLKFTKYLIPMALIVAVSFYGAWVLTVLWGWYAVPLGWAPLTMRAAIGVITMAGVLLAGPMVTLSLMNAKMKGADKNLDGNFALAFMFLVTYTGSLFAGWFYRLFL